MNGPSEAHTSPKEDARSMTFRAFNSSREQGTNEADAEHAAPEGMASSLLPSSRYRLVPQDSRRVAREIVRRAGDYLAYATLLTMLIVIPNVIYHALMNHKLDLAAYKSAQVMVIGTVILSIRLVYLHLTHWYMPDVQKYVVRILWMVPLYAVQSFLSLRFHEARIYIDTIRDLYEAYVISSFVYYLIELLGGQDALVGILMQKRDTGLGRHPFPLSLIMNEWDMGIEFMLQCKHGVLQYVVYKIPATFITFFCESIGIYGEGKFDWKVAYPYLCFFQNISVMYALYCLIKLYSAIHDELSQPINWRPLGKFLCIKGVVFFTWWQGVIIFYIKAHGFIENIGSWSSEDVANGLIDYCVVVEMIGFAIAHSYTFTYKEYLPSNIPLQVDDDVSDDHAPGNGYSRSHYRPPATLPQPMKFTDAFWSSTVPNETIEDIQRLRSGVDGALYEALRPQEISLQEMTDQDPQSNKSTFV